MKSLVLKRSIVIDAHKTSVSLEDEFWKGLKEIAQGRDLTLSEVVSDIDTGRQHGNLSSSIRLFVLDHFRSQLMQLSADRAGIGQLAPARHGDRHDNRSVYRKL